ncbi:Serine/threonine-protein kinase 40 [Cricetulus griseus]|uniref:Serine/threonine-protein kinase 40 n=1 Tax=Cricetulus griseus TaxID=10029 RepID=G3GV80_CRIGR|nr:Serine/threonine-protein kinase 40 [Cricetulus griseus]
MLSEWETVVVFYDVVGVVEALHQKNTVHRDLKLGNMVLNKRTHQITITNFCLEKHLMSERDLLNGQRRSPVYISPNVHTRASLVNMWVLSVVLFTMLYSLFPFYDSIPQELFCEIKAADLPSLRNGGSLRTQCVLFGNCWPLTLSNTWLLRMS